jgi:endo-1,4-beta-mannosidase
VILTLGDDDSACNDTDYAPAGDGSGKTLAFYQNGWKGKYLTWVNTIVPMFKNNSTIAMWEIANEPGHAGASPDAATMKAYLDGAAAAIKAQDPNHLISSGANYAGDAGLGDYAYAHSGPNIDVVSFHDYAWDYENHAVVSGNFTTAKAAATALGKPFMSGEAGATAGNACSSLGLANRSSYLKQKADSYLASGIAGILFWDYEPLTSGGSCQFDIDLGDPIITMVKNYRVP